MADNEMSGFVFAVVFILLFSTLLATVPLGLQGQGETGETPTPVDPSILLDFTDGTNWTRAAMTNPISNWYYYEYYALGAFDWIAYADNQTTPLTFSISSKLYYVPFLWLGHTDRVEFALPSGSNTGTDLTIDEIATDAVNGQVRYTMTFETSGNSAGGLVVYWNTTEHSHPYTAWSNDELYFIHGVGLEETVSLDIGSLLLGILFFQLPDIPLGINAFIALPLWACIGFLVWYFVTSLIPLIGGP